jgi:asparagine synthase (glutamine-hydrolysing)
MCGICGILNLEKKPIDQDTVRSMARTMVHRGPDDEGLYFAPGVCLGHRRLSIIDLSSLAHQPLPNEDKTIWVILNGEIYNYRILREELQKKGHVFSSNSDTEVIIHLYEEKGCDCVSSLNGMYAFAVWDEKRQMFLLARDRIGKKPLLYTYQNGNLCFASEFSALLKSNLIKKEINFEALDYYLTFGYIPAPFTIYKNVFKLMPAHILIFKDGKIKIERYWQLDFEKKINISEEEAQEEIFRLLLDAVKIRLYSDVPLGVFLSGGIDSSSIVGLMSQVYALRIKTFSIGFDEFDYNELRYARNIAQYFDTEHKEFIVKPEAIKILPMLIEHYGEPYADPSCIPTYYLSKLCKQYVTVALNGDGGDELFAGYERYQAMIYAEIFQRLPKFLRDTISLLFTKTISDSLDVRKISKRIKRFFEGASLPRYKRYIKWIGVFDEKLKNHIFSDGYSEYMRNFSSEEFFKHCLSNSNKLSLVDRLLKLDTLTYLPYDLMVKVDIASMTCSLEARSPFLDYRLFEFMASLPSNLKIRGLVQKYIFKKIALKFLPQKNIYRKKRGFGLPIGQWFRSELKDYLCEHLLSKKSQKRGYFNPSVVKDLISQHLTGKKDYGLQLWSLLMFELWHQKFVDN